MGYRYEQQRSSNNSGSFGHPGGIGAIQRLGS